MFESLKKKLKSFLGMEKPKKAKKAKTKTGKKVTDKKKIKKDKKLPSDIELKQQAEQITETVPVEFDPGTLKYEPKVVPEKRSFFARLTSGFGTIKITQQDIDDIFYELEIILLENNVALDVVDKIKSSLSSSLLNKEVKKTDIEKTIKNSLKEAIENILIEPPNIINLVKQKSPFVILFFGINGSGKTTTIAKLANYLKKHDISCVLAAADTFRAASIEQLETHANNLHIPIIKSQYGADPASVGFDAIQYAKKHKISCVLIDTAGRMYTKENLMKEMEKIVRVTNPDLKIFIGESITGNDATEQARMFNEAAGIDGMILTKADVDDKGGAALSVSFITNKPIFFLGAGQKLDDLKPFKKTEIIKHLGLD